MIKVVAKHAASVLGAILCWLIVSPIAVVVPKRKGWVAVIGREGGKFLDNAKHFFVQATELAPDLRIVFVARDKSTRDAITAAGGDSMVASALSTAWFLVRCECVVVDSVDWVNRARRYLLLRARKVQIWHGIPLKLVELDRWADESSRWRCPLRTFLMSLRHATYWLTGRMVVYDVLVATSEATAEDMFRSAFRASLRLVAGYPRNAFGAMGDRARALVWSNVDSRIASKLEGWRLSGRKIVLFAPTFRDCGDAPISLAEEDVRRLEAFCEANGCEFVFKLHPADRSGKHGLGDRVHWVDPDSDIYPLLPLTHALVTDYSSIYFDYLWIDRPVLFFRGDDYSKTGRGTYRAMASMIPGPCAGTWEELLRVLARELRDDTFRKDRSRVRQVCFDGLDQNQATRRILAALHASRTEGPPLQ